MRRLHDNGVCEGGKPEGRPLLFKTREMMKPGDNDKADIGKNRGLRVLQWSHRGYAFFVSIYEPSDILR
ncbi:hypothetical protein B2M27_19075 [Kluyvera intermedia]|uniref:Uncharacterized protein n=1 Tax=Kluyvera intermedia TaxID=61648 RepID=A0ABX3UBL0_KLUIN|nr:hypothetical protein B2M27_19075 [Kluyvera intermedia]